MQRKICSKCLIEKEVSEFYSDKRNSDGLYSRCKNCFLQINKNYKNGNREKILIKRKNYYNDNKQKELKRIKNWQKNNKEKINENVKFKYHTNSLFKLSHNVRRRINNYIIKNNINTFEIVGCTPEELKCFLEKKFTDGMSWGNYGFYGWHIDHIIPLSSAKNEEEIYKLCHHTNLQPLWASDNWKKNNKLL